MRFTSASGNEHGFTMAEMMVVVMIIGILAAIAIPTFLNQRVAAQEAALKSDLRNMSVLLASTYDPLRGGFKEPVNVSDGSNVSVDPATQIAVRLSEGIRIVNYLSDLEGFCVVGAHNSEAQNIWAYNGWESDVMRTNADCEPVEGDSGDGDVIAAPEPEPTVAPTTPPAEPTTAPSTPAAEPTTAPEPTPTTEPTTAPTTAPTTEPTVTPTTAPSPSPSPTTAPTTTAPAPSPSPTPTTPPVNTSPHAASWTITHISGGNASLKAKFNNASGQMATLRVSASPITTQTGYYYGQVIPSSGEVTISSHQLKKANPVYWQIELGSRSNVVSKGSVSATNPVVSGP